MQELEQTNSPSSKVYDHDLLARLVIREGRKFKEAAVLAGYAPTVAQNGLKALCAQSSLVSQAIDRETNACILGFEKHKPLAVRRLLAEITDLKRPAGIKAIEVLGRFKEADWFVRNVDVQIGIFNALGEPSDPASDALSSYQDEPDPK